MTTGVPEKGERITILWPGGKHDFVMIFEELAQDYPPPLDGYAWLYGEIVEPAGRMWDGRIWNDWRVLHARPTGNPGEYSLVGNKPQAEG